MSEAGAGVDAMRLVDASGLSRNEALMLLAHASGSSKVALLAGSAPVADAPARAFERLVRRRRDGEPVAYLVGRREFHGRDFAVDARVLVPRPETELLVERALAWIDGAAATRPRPRVVDLGTGSGIVAITIALERPAARVDATDRSSDALDVARANAAALGAAVRWHRGDWFAAFDDAARFDLVVSNPPYVATGDPHLDALRFEPAGALVAGRDGLDAIDAIVTATPAWLEPGGALLLEHGWEQAPAVRERLARAGLVGVASWRDLAGIERVSVGTAPL